MEEEEEEEEGDKGEEETGNVGEAAHDGKGIRLREWRDLRRQYILYYWNVEDWNEGDEQSCLLKLLPESWIKRISKEEANRAKSNHTVKTMLSKEHNKRVVKWFTRHVTRDFKKHLLRKALLITVQGDREKVVVWRLDESGGAELHWTIKMIETELSQIGGQTKWRHDPGHLEDPQSRDQIKSGYIAPPILEAGMSIKCPHNPRQLEDRKSGGEGWDQNGLRKPCHLMSPNVNHFAKYHLPSWGTLKQGWNKNPQHNICCPGAHTWGI